MRQLGLIPEDLICKFYQGKRSKGEPPSETLSSISCYNKLGETVLLSSIPEQANAEGRNILLGNSQNSYFDSVFKDNPFVKVSADNNSFHFYTERFNLGNGNIIQQIQRLLGLKATSKPKGSLYSLAVKKPNRIGVHVDGISAGRFCGSKRSIYSDNLKSLENFIKTSSRFEFIQFGQGSEKDETILPSGVSIATGGNKKGLLDGAMDFLNRGIPESINLAATCEYFICLNSSFYHIAAALGCKIICVINNPKIEECFLPILVNEMPQTSPPYDVFDKIWLYPQAVHLHQDGENLLVPRFSEQNLKKAINGEIYPFWTDEYLDLIHGY